MKNNYFYKFQKLRLYGKICDFATDINTSKTTLLCRGNIINFIY